MLYGYERARGGHLNFVSRNDGAVYIRIRDRDTVSLPVEERLKNIQTAAQVIPRGIFPDLIYIDKAKSRALIKKVKGINLGVLIPMLECAGEIGLLEQVYYQLGRYIRVVHQFPHPKNISPVDYACRIETQVNSDLSKLLHLNNNLPRKLKFDDGHLHNFVTLEVLPEIKRTILSYPWIGCNHGDFWEFNAMGEISNDGFIMSALIDTEFFKPGIPEEDLAQNQMWGIKKRTYPDQCKAAFQSGYGGILNNAGIAAFTIVNVLDYLRPASPQLVYQEQNKPYPDGEFLTTQLNVLHDRLK
ncbi:hypothetical protein A3C98_03985 [Candidatus Roizmanbacteria bacterium RIFCSPHIGHO2_02_FULL_37_15]|uniref:Uncharacterized protein n=1 Tax=Candidatus Roizmanbacteria bacterium RIFCSPLOWO2_01_FULL_37_16 TaxID=1802058 RepID=A0A1F7IMJ4_9BACT|nr:MAG: hypothetical protein A2859_04275 [Candidatus Roizmanbacteria bacterium RIFCSPHIGHO2_01_FULL_37_16b]OGK22483.1 MAG: hypothetical protein A3C98_03985 [Candidatus Roizmanbacteria bacterium RIFCSPHIGHO2_02_FULL_37_15]OGK33543.1 MAG: hypothetical protein A3F57_05555 [Candidatus Roizmanbacteria bacterium RIFCSPHIGHO2_12_FULL_36_11]OGK44589.1 MAG: hypothetical protein A3B40_05395 [Candidatus Roizmanbacteria bacterium RIFCSPLOWO2_01_FULL_37_16]OGK56507.1 MAG: hypothetical protein A3I50_04600 [C